MKNNHFDIEGCRPTQDQIAARAYELYVQHGHREGRAREDWLQAEAELLHLAVCKPVESSDKKPAALKKTITQGREVSVAAPKRSASSGVKRIKMA